MNSIHGQLHQKYKDKDDEVKRKFFKKKRSQAYFVEWDSNACTLQLIEDDRVIKLSVIIAINKST